MHGVSKFLHSALGDRGRAFSGNTCGLQVQVEMALPRSKFRIPPASRRKCLLCTLCSLQHLSITAGPPVSLREKWLSGVRSIETTPPPLSSPPVPLRICVLFLDFLYFDRWCGTKTSKKVTRDDLQCFWPLSSRSVLPEPTSLQYSTGVA